MGVIVRTAGAERTKAEIKRDYEYLQRMWEQIRELTLKSIAPAKIYEEGDLIKRSIRDLDENRRRFYRFLYRKTDTRRKKVGFLRATCWRDSVSCRGSKRSAWSMARRISS